LASNYADEMLYMLTFSLCLFVIATEFAVSMGFQQTNLSTENSVRIYENWKNANCQPNFREVI